MECGIKTVDESSKEVILAPRGDKKNVLHAVNTLQTTMSCLHHSNVYVICNSAQYHFSKTNALYESKMIEKYTPVLFCLKTKKNINNDLLET